MVEIKTGTNGRRYVRDYGELYRVYAHRFDALEIERIDDGWTAFFQGDDADLLRDDLDNMTPRWDVDYICDEYAHILNPPHSAA